MKQINVFFEDEEYKELLNQKDNLTWHDFILNKIERDKKIEEEDGDKR